MGLSMKGTALPAKPTLSAYRVFLVLLLFVVTFILLQGVSGTVRTPIKKPLSLFPTVLGEWQALASQASSQAVVEMLGVDDYIEFNYVGPSGPAVNFYAAFYEAVGVGGGYHSPQNCIPGGGWGIDAVKTLQIEPRGGHGPVTVSEMIIRNRNEYQVVLYWYQNRGRIIHSEYWEKIYQVLDAIFLKRRDGTFVRLMTPAPGGDIQQAEKTLQQFAGWALPELDTFLPGR